MQILQEEKKYAFLAIDKARKLGPKRVILELKKSLLRGRGGAGFPTGLKWEATFCDKADIKYVVCNAHEGEPQTLKDEFILENFSHLVLSGIIIAAQTIGAKKAFIVLNSSYKNAHQLLKKEIKNFSRKGKLYGLKIEIVLAQSFYIGGEESSLLNEIEKKRVEPRQKPPFVCNIGLYGAPTIVNNVETFSNIPFIISEGHNAYKKIGSKNSPGKKIVTISGNVKNPGVYEIELGMKLKDVIALAGADFPDIKFVLTGGYSGTIVLPNKLNISFDFDSLAQGVALGAGTIVVYNKKTDSRKCLREWLSFFAQESCGQCTPCREGLTRAYEIVSKKGRLNSEDEKKLLELFDALKESSFCPLGSGAPTASEKLLQAFRKELIVGK